MTTWSNSVAENQLSLMNYNLSEIENKLAELSDYKQTAFKGELNDLAEAEEQLTTAKERITERIKNLKCLIKSNEKKDIRTNGERHK